MNVLRQACVACTLPEDNLRGATYNIVQVTSK